MSASILNGFQLTEVKSIYKNGFKLYEYVTDNKIEALLQNNIGIEFSEDNFHRKTHGCANEREHLERYFDTYNASKKCFINTVQLPKHKWGRIKSENHATLSVMYRPTRHSLCADTYIDIDIVSCSQSIFTNVIKENNLQDQFPNIIDYVETRDELFEYYQDKYNKPRDVIKQLFTMMGFGASSKTWYASNGIEFDNDEFIQALNQEYYELSNIIYEKNPHIIEDVTKSNPTKFMEYTDELSLLSAKKRCVMALYYQTLERICQEACIVYLSESKGFDIKKIVPCQDGFMILKELYYPTLCNECAYLIKGMLGFDLKFVVKPFDEKYEIPAYVSEKQLSKNRKAEEKARKEKEHKNAMDMKKQLEEDAKEQEKESIDKLEEIKLARFEDFEKTHVKIMNKGVYLVELADKNLVKTKRQMVDTYEHLEGITKMGAIGKILVPFIDTWMCMNPNIRCKDDMDFYPPPLQAPSNMHNLWTPFAGQVLVNNGYTHQQDAVDKFRHHLYILCNHLPQVADYFERWIAQMIQYPAVKSNCPIFISKEGAGKGTAFYGLSAILGFGKVFETTTPERDVWGSFNSPMAESFLVNVNELSKQQTIDCMGVIKGLVTDNALTINTKGVPQYKIKSYHRWIITTNKDDPMPIDPNDRRFWVVRTSDELIGNKEYFKQMHEMLHDKNAIASIFNYFNTLAGADQFGDIPKPRTEYHMNLQEGNISIPEQWLKDLATISTEDKIEWLGQQTFQSFNAWKDRTGVKYEIHSLKLGVQLSNLNNPGIIKGRHTNKGETKIFDIKLLKKHFKIGCLVQFDQL